MGLLSPYSSRPCLATINCRKANIKPFVNAFQRRHKSCHTKYSEAGLRTRREPTFRVQSFEDSSKALKEAAALDELIDVLLSAKSQQQLAQLVAENMFSFDRKFWMRLANRNDSCTSSEEKQKLQGMANTVMLLIDEMVRQTESQLQDSATILQDILKAAADEKGEWYLPLSTDQIGRLRAALEKHSDHLDEALLSNAFAYIKKCQDDGFDSMARLIQKVLQLYAARMLRSGASDGVEGALNEVVYADEEQWDPLIGDLARSGRISEVDFMEAIQRRMEGVVLGLMSGSYAQRVQAEYLKEIEQRAKGVFRTLAAQR